MLSITALHSAEKSVGGGEKYRKPTQQWNQVTNSSTKLELRNCCDTLQTALLISKFTNFSEEQFLQALSQQL